MDSFYGMQARNSEKAMTALARWRRAQLGDTKEDERRPFLATECDDLRKAEKWRRQILGEVSRKVAQVQNAGLGEFKLRDLNDEINKLLREKGHWEDQILALGGPDYKRVGPKMLDHEGKEVPGNRGYKYFGAAKDLPGVRELFQQAPPPPPRKTRAELMKDVDADYYGYRDEDDGVLVPREQEEEVEAKARLAEKAGVQDAVSSTAEDAVPDIYAQQQQEDGDGDGKKATKRRYETEGSSQFVAHVPVPSQKQVEEALVERKKRELLERYASDSLQSEAKNVQQMLGVS